MKAGFTILELLVVIAIIGVLATVVVINVSEARKAAYNSRVVETARIYRQVLSSHVVNSGQYPKMSPTDNHAVGFCLGSGIDIDGDGLLECRNNQFPWEENPYFDAQLEAEFGKLPKFETDKIFFSGTGDYFFGIVLSTLCNENPASCLPGYRILNGVDIDGVAFDNLYVMYYMLNGTNRDCLLRPVLTTGSETGFIGGGTGNPTKYNLSISTDGNTASNMWNRGEATFCAIWLEPETGGYF